MLTVHGFTFSRLTPAPQLFVRHCFCTLVPASMANPRARPPNAITVTTGNTEYFLPQRPPSWLQPSICTQPDFHTLSSSLDLLFMVTQHIRRHPLSTDPMPNQTYFQDQRAYNLLYRMRGDLMLMDRLIDSLSQARRLLQFVTTGPGLPGQYRIDPTAELTTRNLAILHNTPPGFPLPRELASRSPSPAPRTPPQDAELFHHYWTGPPPQAVPHNAITNNTRTRERSRSRDARSG